MCTTLYDYAETRPIQHILKILKFSMKHATHLHMYIYVCGKMNWIDHIREKLQSGPDFADGQLLLPDFRRKKDPYFLLVLCCYVLSKGWIGCEWYIARKGLPSHLFGYSWNALACQGLTLSPEPCKRTINRRNQVSKPFFFLNSIHSDMSGLIEIFNNKFIYISVYWIQLYK